MKEKAVLYLKNIISSKIEA